MNVSIIGKYGDLASALESRLSQNHHVTSYSKDQYNFLDKNQIVDLVEKIHESDLIINCAGVAESTDSWDMFTVNAIAPIYLLEKLVEKQSRSRLIMIGSHGATWPSWPDISFQRLAYNISKKTLHEFVIGLDHSKSTNLLLNMINFSKFQTKLNGYQGDTLDTAVNSVIDVVESDAPLLIYEYRTYK